MNIVLFIVFFLIISPFVWVITDYSNWKIKNYFIYPMLILSVILTFFTKWFYNFDNIIWIILIVFFWYLFYVNNKWGAWDWKYIILLWINSLLISYLL